MAKYLVNIWRQQTDIIQFSGNNLSSCLKEAREIARGNSTSYFDRICFSVENLKIDKYVYYGSYHKNQFKKYDI